jgi:hypothetical protein
MNHSPDEIQVVLGDHARFQVDPGEITMPVIDIITVKQLIKFKPTNSIDLTSDALLVVFVFIECQTSCLASLTVAV